MKKIILTLIAVSTMLSTIAQNPDLNRTNHWYFGLKAGLDFSSGSPVADTSGKLQVLEGNATISDTSGNLLFYSEGYMVWNALHDTMMNGTGLGVAPIASPQDAIAIIPKPGSNNIYYIFTVDGWEHQYQNGMRWHEVDMTLDNGKGAVTSKNNVLFAPSTEQIAATKHANGCDYWVTSHERGTANFRSYLVTSNGVNPVPVISASGTNYFIPQQITWYSGGFNLLFSPDGSKAGVMVSYAFPGIPFIDTLEIFNFDKNTASFNMICKIPIDSTAGDFCFSPNSQLLYMEMGYWIHYFYQFDISSGIDSVINNSKTLIHNGVLRGIAGSLQLGKDGKLYTGVSTALINPSDTLTVINYPNLQGTACGLQVKSLPLKRHMQINFPNFVSNFLVNDSSSNCIVGIYEDNSDDFFEVSPNPATDYIQVKNKKIYNSANFEIALFNIDAREIYRKKFNNSEAILSIKQYTNGMYLLQIKKEKKIIFNKKFIIQH